MEIFLFLVMNIVYKSLLSTCDLEVQSCMIMQYLLDITHCCASGSCKILRNGASSFNLFCN